MYLYFKGSITKVIYNDVYYELLSAYHTLSEYPVCDTYANLTVKCHGGCITVGYYRITIVWLHDSSYASLSFLLTYLRLYFNLEILDSNYLIH